MKRGLVVLAAWLVVAIVYSQAEALDDFDLAKYGDNDIVEIGRNNFIVKLITYTNRQRLTEAFEKANGITLEEGTGVRGFAVMSDVEDVCYVHIIPAGIWDDRESMAIMGHEIYHCALADHKEVLINETAKIINDEQVLGDIEDLYAQDRVLELEWLRKDYEDMGIKIDGS
jgi:hypothetical protein